jgi:hypothetical protein
LLIYTPTTFFTTIIDTCEQEFDSSYKRGQPATFAPNQVIKGWTEAMQLMKEGDKWELYIPSVHAFPYCLKEREKKNVFLHFEAWSFVCIYYCYPHMLTCDIHTKTKKDLAYGARGAGRDIPGNSALIFTLEMLKVNMRTWHS